MTDGASGRSIADALGMLRAYMDYTDQVCRAVPADKLDWRPAGADGGYYFSLGESIQHISDTRRQFARQLAGSDSEEGMWNTTYTDAETPWEFRAGTLDELLASLDAGRAELEPWLELPFSDFTQPTPGTTAAYEARLAAKREAGEDTALLERRGPATLASVLLFFSSHEQGHRGVLQTQLRQLGFTIQKMA